MGMNPVPDGHVGTVVTYLEMVRRPASLAVPESPLRLERRERPDPAGYRRLFARVGGRWLWYSRLAMDDRALAAAIGEVHVVRAPDMAEAGMVELDFATQGQCLIRFLGLVPELAGQGHGRWLFAAMLAAAWRGGVERLAGNTSTLDHPAAQPADLRARVPAHARAFEHFPDPRRRGRLPRDAAPQVPIVGSPAS